MVYEVISPEAHGNGTIVGMHTESPACIDSLDTQKAMLDAKSKITFTGTEEEYEAVKAKLNAKVKYQNVFDAFMRCDTDKLAEEFAALYDESKKDAEKRLEAVQKMIHASYERMKNTTLASNEDESMVVVCKSFDDAGDDVACVKAQEIRDWKEKHEKNYEPISDEALTFMSTDEIYNAIIADRLPERYAFEFSPWEEILSWNQAEPSVARYGLEHCLAGILWEMTFFGVDPAGVEKEREKLDAAIEEAKQASAEGKVLDKTFSFEDFAKEVLGDEYTEDWYPEEEQERDRRNMAIASYKYGVEFRLLLESIL